MATVETEHGTFTGETLAEATKRARKAAREAKREEKLRAERHEQAHKTACFNAYRLHEELAQVRAGDREALPRGWRLLPPASTGETQTWRFCASVRIVGERDRDFSGGHIAEYSASSGSGGPMRYEHIGFHVVLVLEYGNGYPCAVVLRDLKYPERHHVVAIGEHEGELAFASVTVSLEELQQAVHPTWRTTVNIEEARKALGRELARSLREGGGCTVEADRRLNDASRALVASVAAECGEAWLGEINLYGAERHGGHPVMWKWDGCTVLNFSCAFVAPRYDAELVRLIRERDDAPWSASADVARVDAIRARVAEIGGLDLIWT